MSYNIVRCSVERCVHNMNDMCNAQYIHIVGDNTHHSFQTDCRTFEVRNFRTAVTNMTNVNLMGVVDQIFTEDLVMNPQVKCTVGSCIYNLGLQGCNANDIQVKGPSSGSIQQTECGTFRKK